MKTKQGIEISETEIQAYINNSIRDWWQLFAADYPQNRELVLEIFDEGLERSQRPKVKAFWVKLKNSFLDSESALKQTEVSK